ncbi:MAG: TetR/AcrR family transcriptional regulator [Actinomycetota bacterium]
MEKKLTKRGIQRREQIVEASFRLFAEQGYHGTTVGDICDELGVGKGVFYWYFKSKEALFMELLRSVLLRLRRAQHSAIEGNPDPVTRIEQGIRASIDFFRAEPGYLSVMRTAARYEEFSHFLHEGQEVVASDTALHIKEGMAAGQIRHGDPELMAHGILGAIFHFVEVYFDQNGGASTDRPQLADEAVAFCLKGLLA